MPVVKKLKELQRNVELGAFKYSLANSLKGEFDEGYIYYFDDILGQIKI
jgi:hypothetical protein